MGKRKRGHQKSGCIVPNLTEAQKEGYRTLDKPKPLSHKQAERILAKALRENSNAQSFVSSWAGRMT